MPTHDAIYSLPTVESSSERSRLDTQHRAITLALGSLYATPLVTDRLSGTSDETTVLDVGTGSGIW